MSSSIAGSTHVLHSRRLRCATQSERCTPRRAGRGRASLRHLMASRVLCMHATLTSQGVLCTHGTPSVRVTQSVRVLQAVQAVRVLHT